MNKLSKTEKTILSNFDGFKANTATIEGTYHAAVKSLAAKGLITYRRNKVRAFPATPGGMVWHEHQNVAAHVVYIVAATQAGKDFIYNGGLDVA